MKPRCIAAILGVAACSSSPEDRELGTAADPQGAAYLIAGVRASPGTVHFTGFPWVIDSAEATGPMVVTTNIGTFVWPLMTTTLTTVDADAVARVVGYSPSERHDVIAVSTANVSALECSRLEAYADFEQISWEVRDTSTSALLGSGSSFIPSGVFFQTVTAYHTALPDTGFLFFSFVPGCEDLACTFPPGAPSESATGTKEHRAPGFVPSAPSPAAAGKGAHG